MNDATDDGIVLAILVIGAAVVGIETWNIGGVGCPVCSLKVALRLLETGVFVTNTEEL